MHASSEMRRSVTQTRISAVKHVVIFYKHVVISLPSERLWVRGTSRRVADCGCKAPAGSWGGKATMKITSIETLRTEEFSNVLWVRVHTDSGIIGLGETFYGAGAVEAHIHDTLAGRLLGRNPLHIEAHSPRHGQPADGAVVHRRGVPRGLGGRYRAVGRLRQGLRPAGPPDARRPVPGPACASTTPAPATSTSAPPTSSRSRTGTWARPAGRSRISTAS